MNIRNITTCFLLLSSAVTGLKAQQADLVLLNGKVITLQHKGDRSQAVAIKGGNIIAVGTNAAIKKYIGTHTQTVQLNGQTVIPGFNDVHQIYLHSND